jgi:hypothetical protein
MNSVLHLPTKLPQIAETGLPVSYEAAKQAIAACESPIECRTLADKAAAMAVYAKMRDDTELHNRAVRLQAWATRRWGELDRELYPDRSKTNLKQNKPDSPECGYSQSGKRPRPFDGTTEHQRVISRRLAVIPEPEFTRQVEGSRPPSVAQLADQGRMRRVQTPDDLTAENFKAACTALHQFATYCDTHDAIVTAQAFSADDVEMARRCVSTLDRWLDLFVTNLSANFG